MGWDDEIMQSLQEVDETQEEEVIDQEEGQENEEGSLDQEEGQEEQVEDTEEEVVQEQADEEEAFDPETAMFPVEIDGKDETYTYKEVADLVRAAQAGQIVRAGSTDPRISEYVNNTKGLVENYSKSQLMKFVHENVSNGQDDKATLRAMAVHYINHFGDPREQVSEQVEEEETMYDPVATKKMNALQKELSENKKILQQISQEREETKYRQFQQETASANVKSLETSLGQFNLTVQELSDNDKRMLTEELMEYVPKGQTIDNFALSDKQMLKAVKIALENTIATKKASNGNTVSQPKATAATNYLKQKSAPRITPGNVPGKESVRGAVQEIKGATSLQKKGEKWAEWSK